MQLPGGVPYNEHMRSTRVLCLLLAAACAGAVGAQEASTPSSAALQNEDELVALAEKLLAERAATWPGQATISVIAPRATGLSACTQPEAFLPGPGTLQPRLSVGIRCLAPSPWTTYLQASVRIIGSYFVTNHLIQKGAVLSLDDLDSREGDLLRNPRLISDPAHVVGWIATRRIPSGKPIETNALRDANSIERGQQVRTIARGTGFVASGEGQALEAGSPGARIQVRTSSGQVITATVIDAHTVQVMM